MERVKNIVVLVSNDHYTDQRMQRICTTLHNHGFKITLIGRYLGNEVVNYGYEVMLLPLKHVSGPRFYYELMRQQVKYVKNNFKTVDIVCTIDTDTLLAGSKIKKYYQCKQVHDAHEWFTEVPELQGKWLKRQVWSWIEKKVLKKIDLGYTVSSKIATHYSFLANKRFHLIHNYPTLKQVIGTDKEYDIIYQGAMNKGRCVQTLVTLAIANDYQVCLCGDGDEFDAIKEMSKGHNNIHLKGMVAPKDLHEFTCKSRIGYNFYELISKSYDESMSNKTFDYMQAEIPQIIPFSKAIYGLNALKPFAVAADKESLTQVIDELLTNKALYKELQQNIIALKVEYTWEKEAVKLIELYTHVK